MTSASNILDELPEFHKYSKWFSATSHNFLVEVVTTDHGVAYRDRGNSAAVLWMPIAAIFWVGLVYLLIETHGHVSRYEVLMAVVAILSTYRVLRILLRKSILTIDVKRKLATWEESWPTRKALSVPLSQTHWIIQPVKVESGRFSWSGYMLRVQLEGESFVIGAKANALVLRHAIREDLRKLVKIKVIRTVVDAPPPG